MLVPAINRAGGRLLPAPSEFGLQASLVDMIRHNIRPSWRFPFLTFRPAGCAARRLQDNWKRPGATAGWPDLAVRWTRRADGPPGNETPRRPAIRTATRDPRPPCTDSIDEAGWPG